jgi:hypothetical protein
MTKANDEWIQAQIDGAQPVASHADELALINAILRRLDQRSGSYERGIALAAGFDLLVAAEYYALAESVGWLSCTDPTPFG